MSVALESPAINRSIIKQKRKRRPTRTPKPFTPQSAVKRLCSPSPFLDRSFQRKKLYFGGHTSPNDSDDESQESSSESEYFPDESLFFDPDDEDEEYHDYDCCGTIENIEEEKQEFENKNAPKRGRTIELINDIENLSIQSNQNNSSLLRNARTSIKTGSKSPSISTPQLFKDINAPKIKKKLSDKKPSDKKQRDEPPKPKTKTKPKVTQIRITKSHRVFNKFHKFDRLLVKPLECGSGCPLYFSFWKEQPTVTKLMPLFENEEFTKEENVDNALREFEFHADIYRKGVKLYGLDETPTCPIYACVNLKHDGECTHRDELSKPYLAFVMPQFHCNLAQFVNKYRKLNNQEANKLLITGLRFLKLLNENQMVHSDIKPENIFLDVRMNKNKHVQVKISHFVFADFGCAALKTEEFPFGNLTGTITMWDLVALGKKYGDEDGFELSYKHLLIFIFVLIGALCILYISERNDLYGLLGSLLDGVYGGCIMEELLEEADEDWKEQNEVITQH